MQGLRDETVIPWSKDGDGIVVVTGEISFTWNNKVIFPNSLCYVQICDSLKKSICETSSSDSRDVSASMLTAKSLSSANSHFEIGNVYKIQTMESLLARLLAVGRAMVTIEELVRIVVYKH